MSKGYEKRTGFLPKDAEQRLIAASKIGSPGSLTRARAIDRAYAYIECYYPEYLRRGN